VHYRTRRAVREVSKVLGLPEETAPALLKSVWGWSNDGVQEEHAREAGLDPSDPRLRLALDLSKNLIGFPRHLSQHVGGFVIARGRLDELVPIENATMKDRTIVQWDKDDIDELRMMKVDVLALGMLTVIRKSFELLEHHYGIKHTLSDIPSNDTAVYKMLQRADSIGVFQVESRAQQSMLPRLKPADFYDLVIEVAIVRPGPIQGDMVHPYLRRREGKEKVSYPSPALENILKKTLGVPLFQEQAMQIAITGAGFSPDEADNLRRSLATFRHVGTITSHRQRFIQGMQDNGYSLEFAERCFSQIEGFGTYGFPESHAISFANLVYVSAWIKCHYPAVFCAALLNSQPMGFYAPAQLVRDAREHGVEIRPIDVNYSSWDSTLQISNWRGKYAIRLGLRLIAGLYEKDAALIVNARGSTAYRSPGEIVMRSGCSRLAVDRLAQADAFSSMRLKRRQAIWKAGAVERNMPPLFRDAQQNLFEDPSVDLPPASPSQEVVEDYVATGLTLRKHPLTFLRSWLREKRVIPSAMVKQTPNNRLVTVAGLVLFRQQPATAHGTIFLSLEDETGVINLIVWKNIQMKFRQAVYAAKLLACRGVVQREGQVLHVVARQIWDWSNQLRALNTEKTDSLPVRSRDFR
jgi:error-prone DNA polymerase